MIDNNLVDYEIRVQKYELEGCTRSDAQAVAEAEDTKAEGN